MHSDAAYPCVSSSGPDSSTSSNATAAAASANAHAPAHDHQQSGLFGCTTPDTRHSSFQAAAVPSRYQPQPPLFDSPMVPSAQQDISSHRPAHLPADYFRSPSTAVTDPAHYRPHTGHPQPFSLHYSNPSELPATLYPPNIHNTSYHSPPIDAVSGYRGTELYRQQRQADYFSPRSVPSIPSIPSTGSLAAIQRPDYLSSPSSYGRSPHMHSPFAGSTSSQQAHFPWPNKEDYAHEHLTCDGHVVKPTIYARMEKGFQMIGGFWTCYRRNYFEVSCAFVLNPFCSNACIMLRGKQVQAFGMGISACVFDRDVNIDERRRVDILQFTPKRDTNDKRDLTIVRVWPGMPLQSHGGHGQRSLPYYATSRGPAFVPVLPYQGGSSRENSPHSGSPQRYPHDALPLVDHAGDGLYKQHTFDRLQFKTATANNGKRRASQQYYCLKIGLYADTRDDGASDPVWHRISEVFSEPLVVRGRSPNHYKNEDSGQDADEREGGEPGPSAHRTASFGRHTGYSYAHHYDSPDESRSRSNVGGFRGYGDNPDNSTPPDGSSESSMTPGDNIVSHFDQMGDDVKEEIRDGYHDAPGMNNYSYAPAPFTEPLSGPLPTDHQYQDSHNRLAYRMEHPGSLAAPRWEELDDSAMYRPATLQAFPSSEGFYPLNMTNDLTGSIDLFSRPDTAFQVHTQLHEQ